MNMKPNPLGHPMIGFAVLTIDTTKLTIKEIGEEVEKAIDGATDTAKNRGVRLENVEITPIQAHFTQERGLLLVFTIGRN